MVLVCLAVAIVLVAVLMPLVNVKFVLVLLSKALLLLRLLWNVLVKPTPLVVPPSPRSSFVLAVPEPLRPVLMVLLLTPVVFEVRLSLL